jgi:uncharacterized damage-inducible protein DinB
MSRHPLGDAFQHNVWATVRLIDACADLTSDQLQTEAPGTRGPIIETLRHLVASDSWYLSFFRDEGIVRVDGDQPAELPDLRTAILANGDLWLDVLAEAPDPDTQIDDAEEDWRYVAPVGVRLAQAVHHGTDHRSQICSALTVLGLTPPDIDVWAYGNATGRCVQQKIESGTRGTAS